jgi:hypothetical protein
MKGDEQKAHIYMNAPQVAVLDEKGKLLNNSRVDNNLVNRFIQECVLSTTHRLDLYIGILFLRVSLPLRYFG